MNTAHRFLNGDRFVMFWIKLACKGICHRYKAPKPYGKGRYAIGQKRCQICDLFIWVEDKVFCPCCGVKLRAAPRNKKWKEKVLNYSRI